MCGIEWRCENGHVLGLVMKNGRGVKQLLLYREAKAKAYDAVKNMAGLVESLHKEDRRRRTGDGGREVEVIAVVRYATDIRCSICGAKKYWISKDEIEELGMRLEKLTSGRRAAPAGREARG